MCTLYFKSFSLGKYVQSLVAVMRSDSHLYVKPLKFIVKTGFFLTKNIQLNLKQAKLHNYYKS